MIIELFRRLKLLYKKRRVRNDAKRLGLENYSNVEELFSDYFHNKTWSGGKKETVSGSGSTLKKTRLLRQELPKLLARYEVKSIFDAPCGDFNWFQHVERGSIRYIGGDIVKGLVVENSRKYSDHNTDFMHFDILNDEAPEADVWICREVLLHLSNSLIFEFLRNFSKNRIHYLLVTTHYKFPENFDIPTGAGRPVNLEIAPFNLPKPIDYVEDEIGGGRPMRMGLWERETIVRQLGDPGRVRLSSTAAYGREEEYFTL
jgi:hypothetical protein